MSWQDVRSFYEEPDDYEPDWRTLRYSTHTARIPHHCDTCDCLIQPGQRYQIMVALDEGEFKIWRHHVMGGCQFREPHGDDFPTFTREELEEERRTFYDLEDEE
jgi:hypothetical protein